MSLPLPIAFVFAAVFFRFSAAAAEPPPVNNAALLPVIVPDERVRMEGLSPDWVKTLIMAELRIETATPEGTFASAVKVLDHYAETGVNGLWICPVWERGSKGNGYGSFGPALLEPLLTGAAEFEKSLEAVKHFVDEAHRRNIRVLFDVVVWGTRKDAPLVTEHPEFYKRLPDGSIWEVWGGYGFDWESDALRKWYREAAVNFILKTGADGYRVDLAPDTSGYFFKEIREELYVKGRKIALISEMPGERNNTFDFEQNGVTGWTEEPDYANPARLREQTKRFGKRGDFLLRSSLIEAVQSGTGIGAASLQQQGRGGAFRFYTQCLLNHDDAEPYVKGSRMRFGYTAVFAPFIPLWWIGEEWNNPKKLIPDPEGGVMYFNTIDWTAKESAENRRFFEDVKRFIRIRREHSDVFEVFPDSSRNANIMAVESRRNGLPNPLQAYARFTEGKAVLIVPNYESAAAESEFEISVPLERLKFPAEGTVEITDLLIGNRIMEASAGAELTLKMRIPNDHLAVILVELN